MQAARREAEAKRLGFGDPARPRPGPPARRDPRGGRRRLTGRSAISAGPPTSARVALRGVPVGQGRDARGQQRSVVAAGPRPLLHARAGPAAAAPGRAAAPAAPAPSRATCLLAPHRQLDVAAGLHRDRELGLRHRDEQPAAVPAEPEPQRRPVGRAAAGRTSGGRRSRACRRSRRRARSTRRPSRRRARRRSRCCAGRRGRRRATCAEVLQREVPVADLGRDDRLDDGGQRRVPGRQRVVVVEVGALHARR